MEYWEVGKDEKRPADRKEPAGPGAALGAVAWVREKLGFEPDEVKARVLSTASKRGVLNCTRQWGKSTITAAKAVHQACTEAGSLTLVVSLGGRQSGEFVRKADLDEPRMDGVAVGACLG